MSRPVRSESLRVSDVIRLYPKERKPGFGRRVVIVRREVFEDSVRVTHRNLTGGKTDRRISDSPEGQTFLARPALNYVEGVWEGDVLPSSPGRIIEYNNRRVDDVTLPEGESKMAAKAKGKTAGKGKAAAKSSGGGERATEAQLDKLSAQVVKLRDSQGKSWTEVCDTLDIAPSRARQLYNRGGGEPTPRAASAGTKTKASAKGKTAAKGKGKGKKNPS